MRLLQLDFQKGKQNFHYSPPPHKFFLYISLSLSHSASQFLHGLSLLFSLSLPLISLCCFLCQFISLSHSFSLSHSLLLFPPRISCCVTLSISMSLTNSLCLLFISVCLSVCLSHDLLSLCHTISICHTLM